MELRKNLLTNRLPPTSLRGVGDNMATSLQKKTSRKQQHDFSPSSWTKYFDKSEDVEIQKNKFRVYRTGTEGPILLLLHGGGYSALTWSLLNEELKSRVVCQTVAIDLRGHGNTITENDEDLSKDTLAADIGHIVDKLYGDEAPPVVLVGHSMGG